MLITAALLLAALLLAALCAALGLRLYTLEKDILSLIHI